MTGKLNWVRRFISKILLWLVFALSACKSESLIIGKNKVLLIGFGDHFLNDKIDCSINNILLYRNHTINSSPTDGNTNLELILYEDDNKFLVVPHIKNEGIKTVPKLGQAIFIKIKMSDFIKDYKILPSDGMYVDFTKAQEGKLIMRQSKKL